MTLKQLLFLGILFMVLQDAVIFWRSLPMVLQATIGLLIQSSEHVLPVILQRACLWMYIIPTNTTLQLRTGPRVLHM